MAAELDLVTESRTYIQKLQVPAEEIQARLQSLTAFERVGLPSSRNEDWKYIAWSKVAKNIYKPLEEGVSHLSKMSMAAGTFGLTSKDAVYYNPNEFHVWRLLNQELQQSPSSSVLDPMSISFHIENHALQNVSVSEQSTSLDLLFDALATKVLRLTIAGNTSVAKPLLIHELFVNAVASQQHQSVEIIVGQNSKVQIIYFDQSQGASFFRQLKTKVILHENASLDFIRVQNLGQDASMVDQFEVVPAQGAVVKHLTVSLGAQLYRQNLVTDICHRDIEVVANGLAVLNETQMTDVYTQLRHQSGGSLTRQTFKSLLADQSKLNFNGMILIAAGAKKASSEQLNKNLLLSTRAEANSKPQLQIYSDDVKATHGSTTGQLNRDEIFYFQSRAISEQQAVQMLSVGHVSELIYQIDAPVIQEFVLDQVKHKLMSMKFETSHLKAHT